MVYYEYGVVKRVPIEINAAHQKYIKYIDCGDDLLINECLFNLRAIPISVIKKKYPRICHFEADDLISVANIKMWRLLKDKKVPTEEKKFRQYLYSACACAMIDHIRCIAKRFPPDGYVPDIHNSEDHRMVDNRDLIENLPIIIKNKITMKLKRQRVFSDDEIDMVVKIAILLLFNKIIPLNLYAKSSYDIKFLKDLALVYLRISMHSIKKSLGDIMFDYSEFGIDIENL